MPTRLLSKNLRIEVPQPAVLGAVGSAVALVTFREGHTLRVAKSFIYQQRFSNFFQVGTTFISQNVLRTTLLLGLSNSLGLP